MSLGGFGGATERLSFVLQLDDRGAVRAFGQLRASASRDLGEVDDRLDRIGGRMQVAGAGAIAFAGVAGRALASFASASEEAESESRKLDQAIANNADLVGESRKPYDDLAQSLQDLTGSDGDAIVGLEGMLGTLGRTRDEILTLTPLVVDLATRYGLDFESAGRLVNNAVEGNTTRLERLIGTMGEGESVAEALSRTVGGFAEREAQSLSGQLRILQANLGDIEEAVGVGVVGAVNDAIGPVSGFIDTIAEGNPKLLESAGRVAAIGTAAVGGVGAVSLLAGTAIKMRDNLTAATGSARAFSTAMKFAGIAVAAAFVASEIQSIREEAASMAEDLGANAREALNTKDSYEEFAAGLAAVDRGIDDLGDTLRGSQAPWDADKRVQLRAGVDELEGLREEYGAVEQQIRDLSAAEGISLDTATERILSARRQTAAHEELVAAVGEEAAAEQEATDADEERRAESDRLVEAFERRREANQKLLDSTLALFDGEIGLRAAERETADAIEAASTATAEHGVFSREASEAVDEAAAAALRQADAALEVRTAQAEANGVTLSAGDAARIQRERLEQIAATLAPGSQLRLQLQGYIDQLRLTQGEFVATLTTRYNGPISGNTAGSRFGQKAAGGRFMAGDVDLVGERGPELVQWGSSGNVIPNDRIAAAGDTIINVAVDRAYVDERRLGEKIGRDIAWAMR